MHAVLPPVELAGIDETRNPENAVAFDAEAPTSGRSGAQLCGMGSGKNCVRSQARATGGGGDHAVLSEVEPFAKALAKQLQHEAMPGALTLGTEKRGVRDRPVGIGCRR